MKWVTGVTDGVLMVLFEVRYRCNKRGITGISEGRYRCDTRGVTGISEVRYVLQLKQM